VTIEANYFSALRFLDFLVSPQNTLKYSYRRLRYEYILLKTKETVSWHCPFQKLWPKLLKNAPETLIYIPSVVFKLYLLLQQHFANPCFELVCNNLFCGKSTSRGCALGWVDFWLFYIFNKHTPEVCCMPFKSTVRKMKKNLFDPVTTSSLVLTSWVIHYIRVKKNYLTIFLWI
jgi:hypothetical protein